MFQGYSQETVDFMWGIRFNNERGWFLAHKDDYQRTCWPPPGSWARRCTRGCRRPCPGSR